MILIYGGVTKDLLETILKYCEHYGDKNVLPTYEPDDLDKPVLALNNYDANFISKIDIQELPALLNATLYLGIKSLNDLLCYKLAQLLKGKQPEQIRSMLNITDDLSGPEKAAVKAVFDT